jgi:hypothetical protein
MEKQATGIYMPDGSRPDIEIAHDEKLTTLGWTAIRMPDKALNDAGVSVDRGVGVSSDGRNLFLKFFDFVESLGKALLKRLKCRCAHNENSSPNVKAHGGLQALP